jgi:hypothetical protein
VICYEKKEKNNLVIVMAAILILTDLGATTGGCPYKSGKYLPIIGNFMGVGAGKNAGISFNRG